MKTIKENLLRDTRFPVHRIADKLLPYIKIIVNNFDPEKVVLFGSYAYGNPTADSDVDLLVVKKLAGRGYGHPKGFPTIEALGCQLGFRYHGKRPRGFAIATFQRGCFSFVDHGEGNPVGMKKFDLKYDKHTLSQFCKDRGIRRLSLFGSALRDDFRPGESDFDVLAEFEHGALRGIGLDFFSYGSDLEKILGGKVDFCSKLNRYIRPIVEKECPLIYEQV